MVPNPIGWEIDTVGVVVYTTPPSLITIEVTVPAMDTTAVADAPTLLSWEIIVIEFWNANEVSFSFVGLKNGLTLSTRRIVLPTPTGWIKYEVGVIAA